MNVQDLRLGMPYYAAARGVISVTVITDLKFSNQDDLKSAVEINHKLMLPDFLQRTSIAWAIEVAKNQLVVMLGDDTRTINQDTSWSDRLAVLETDAFQEEQERLLRKFSETKPLSHFSLGTKLWNVQPDCMNMLVGPLVRLDSRGKQDHLNPWFDRGVIQYKNGQYPGMTHQHRFFDDKDKALDALAAYVKKRYPVTLDRNRVSAVPTATFAESLSWTGD
jgi:hypothetical protein